MSRRSVMIGGTLTVLGLVCLLVIGMVPRRAQEQRLAARARAAAAADSIPEVTVTRVSRAQPTSHLVLPGTIQGMHETAIYARSSGYVRQWLTDIGTRVRAGQLMAVIDAPDLDQQLRQARAALRQAEAAFGLSRAEMDRWRVLLRDSAVTREEFDQRFSTYNADSASVAAAQANVERLASLQQYERITAPFAGVVTARNVDDGVLVSASGSIGATGAVNGGSLFRIARTDTVRIYVGVPESSGPAVRPGLTAVVRVRELPGRTFTGRVARSADAFDPATRTLLTEVDIVNEDRVLLPGMYADAQFQFTRGTPPLLLPANTLIVRTGGPQAAVVGPDSTVHVHALDVVRDYGPAVEVDSGVVEGDLVVVNPSDAIHDGSRVHVRAVPGAPPTDQPRGTPVPPPPAVSARDHA